jgi:hypothetical protein
MMDIREHMDIVDAEGKHVGTVDEVEGDRVKLTKKESPALTASIISSTPSRLRASKATR